MILEKISYVLRKTDSIIGILIILRAKIFFNFLKRSKIFWYWYEDHLNGLAYDLDISEYNGTKETLEKYYKQLDKARKVNKAFHK